MAESVLDTVRPLLPAIAAAAAAVDRDGAVGRDTVAELRDLGAFAMLQPASFDGKEVGPDHYLAVIREISAACTSTGWLVATLGVNAWHLALFDHLAQQDVWGSDCRSLVAASYAPTGQLERIGDHFRLSGRWTRCTGVRHASWLTVGALIMGEDGAADDYTVALVPGKDFAIVPTWNPLGLRGIGADDVVISGASVPTYRTFGWVSSEQRTTLSPLYRLPQPILYLHAETAPALGAAIGVVDARRADITTPLSPIAMAEASLRLSIQQIRRNLAEHMDCARIESSPDSELMLRTRRDQVLAFEHAVNVVRLFVQRDSSDDDDYRRAERLWRDMQTAGMHVANDVDGVLSSVGQFAFGLKVDDFVL